MPLIFWGVFGFDQTYLSHEKKAPGCLGYIGDEILPRYEGITINHEIKTTIQQAGFTGK